MPNESLKTALKEAYALVPTTRTVLDTLQLSHPSLTQSVFMVADKVAHTFTLETGVATLFSPIPFQLILPAANANGFQALTVAIGNIDRSITDFFEDFVGSTEPLETIYRPYLSDEPTVPQLVPPLKLFLSDVKIDVFQVSGRATFVNASNANTNTELYTRARFPSLGN